MRTVDIGGRQFSRLICGTNAFHGNSHFSAARDAEYRGRFTDEYIESTINCAADHGINTVETSASERMWGIFDKVRQKRSLLTIGSTRVDGTSQMKSHQQRRASALLWRIRRNQTSSVWVLGLLRKQRNRSDWFRSMRGRSRSIRPGSHPDQASSSHGIRNEEARRRNSAGARGRRHGVPARRGSGSDAGAVVA